MTTGWNEVAWNEVVMERTRLACVFIHGIQHAHKVRICSSRKKKLVTKPGNMFYCPTK